MIAGGERGPASPSPWGLAGVRLVAGRAVSIGAYCGTIGGATTLTPAKASPRGGRALIDSTGSSLTPCFQPDQSQPPTSGRRSWRVRSKWSGVTVM